jgi:leader peptidase (prepilin peptidase) / N-methyltransferase
MTYEILYYIALFLIGLFVGSFLNLVSDRVVRDEQVIKGHSKCEFCGNTLRAKNLIPVFSFLFQRGKCSFCGEKLSVYYPLSEIITALCFVVAAMYTHLVTDFNLTNILMFVYLLGSFCFLVILFLTDSKYQLLPDKIVFSAIIFTVVSVLIIYSVDLKLYHDRLQSDSFGKYLLQAGFWKQAVTSYVKGLIILIGSSFLISLFFLLLIIITKGRGMGGGDVKLGFLIGVFNGVPYNLLAIFLGFLLGAIYSLLLIVFRRKSLKDTVAFGPFLILGAVISFIWGPVIVNWYLKML